MTQTRFVHVGTNEFGSTWVNPDRITGFYIQRLGGAMDGEGPVYGAQLLTPQGVQHLVDGKGEKAFWPTPEAATTAVAALLKTPLDGGGLHGASEFVAPSPRRLSGLALIRNEHGDVLVVEKAYRRGQERFGLVGGHAEGGEAAVVACHREIAEETGLHIVPGRVLAAHHMPATDTVAEGVSMVFDCGTVSTEQPLTLPEGELLAYQWLSPARFAEVLAPYQAWRVNVALDAAGGGPVRYLVGHPASPVGGEDTRP
ncbi:NUDIX hydrolase [Streptomyces sp. MP131-18]|uniref:NUDIX domain-containing protein n=1 Tax=Streptomyces sp. MP131-18 TaxID=1857892 RepID=UPI00097C22DD|nr:NUDIX hydrolase [Streptomyces sp. MP131-18]ONK10064.1 NTP pyrophosphohydrolase containing a Zn-finger [Streptomyces sp. MP131-18]